jgi:uncharacterized protein
MLRRADLRWNYDILRGGIARRVSLPRLRLPSAVSVAHDGVRVDRDAAVPMRDGVVLRADVYRPVGPPVPSRLPVVLIRMPYGKGEAYCQMPAHGRYWAQRGYACVIQDVRGRWGSGGAFEMFVNEAADGYDTLDWVAAQPWCDGNIGMTGESYYGYTQWAVAPLGHPHLRCIAPGDTAADVYGSWAYVDNCFCLQTMGRYACQMQGSRDVNYYGYDPWHMPLTTIDDASGVPSRLHKEWIAHPARDSYWQAVNVDDRYADIDIPVLHHGGWYDVFLSGTIGGWEGVRAAQAAGTPSPHVAPAPHVAPQHLLIGPTDHEHTPETSGRVGRTPVRGLGYSYDRVLGWMDRWLRGDEKAGSRATVEVFLTGRDEWLRGDEWPLSGTGFVNYYLGAGGSLAPAAPAPDQPPDTYTYDPDDPLHIWLGADLWHLAEAMRDRRSLAARVDVLVYETEPLTAGLDVVGPLRVTLFAASSAPDTDFTAALVDVFPDGGCQFVQEGIVRARWRESDVTPSPIEPGEVYEYGVDLWATAYAFAAGHRLRIEISSSNFDRYDRNPNTGHPFGQDAERRPARQTIFHDAARASHLTLPVLERHGR